MEAKEPQPPFELTLGFLDPNDTQLAQIKTPRTCTRTPTLTHNLLHANMLGNL